MKCKQYEILTIAEAASRGWCKVCKNQCNTDEEEQEPVDDHPHCMVTNDWV